MWDVIIVGARCAGATVALRFARSRRRVLLLERGEIAADTLSTHILTPPAMARLDALGLMEGIRALGPPPVKTMLIEFDGKSYARPMSGPHGHILSVRRTSLDPFLAAMAEEASAVVRERMRVEDVLWEGGRVVGVRGSDADGRAFAERASLVIGADGRHSVIARQVSAAEYDRLDCPSGALYAYWRGVGPTVAGDDALQFASGSDCDTLCCPCDGALHVTLLIVDNEEFAAVAGNPARYDARLRDVPTLAPRLDGAERVGKIHPASPRELRGFFRHPYGPGWSLIGDAGYYAHPAAAQGIGDALRSGELVHILVERAWAEGLPAETYLADYQRTRDDENRDSFAHSYRLGQVNPFFDPLVAARMLPQTTPPIT